MKVALSRILDLLEAGDVRGAEIALLDLLDALRAAPNQILIECEHCGAGSSGRDSLEAHLFQCVAAWRKAS